MTGTHWTSSAAHHARRQRKAGATAKVSIPIRYCTTTAIDKLFGKMPNVIP
jgi:hypothetical protein